MTKTGFALDDLKTIQHHFHTLIIERATEFNCIDFLADEGKQLPEISNEAFVETTAKRKWYPVPGMYGGFAYRLIKCDEKPLLVTESWCRVIGGSGERHEITADGCVLVERGYV